MRLDKLDIPWGEGPFSETKRISFELSSLCNYSHLHKECPVTTRREKEILPTPVIMNVLDTCVRHRYRGLFAFHLYNEPGIDPRLLWLFDEIKSRLPDARLFLLTNGWYLNQSLADDFCSHGLDYLGITVYSREEHQRLERIQLPIPVSIITEKLDDRKEWYDRDNPDTADLPCYYPLYEICITASGLVGLCPYDWKRAHTFGNLHQEDLEDILEKENLQSRYRELSAGRRTLPVCRGCGRTRGERKYS